MFLGVQMLKNVQSVNSFEQSAQVRLRQGNPSTIYFQLVDLEQVNKYGEPLRYVPANGATCTATISSINQAYVITRACSQPYSQDGSIWAMTILASDTVVTGNFQITLSEGSTVRTAYCQMGVVVQSISPSEC